jgi:hypothetical protein
MRIMSIGASRWGTQMVDVLFGRARKKSQNSSETEVSQASSPTPMDSSGYAHGIGRENYVRIICNGYLILGKPIPEEFWDEWEAIQAKERIKSADELLLEIPPDPMEVWVVLKDGNEFQVLPDGPANGGSIKLSATTPYTGEVDHGRLQRPDGTLLAKFDVFCNAMVAGDTLTVMLDSSQMLNLLQP